MMPKKTMRILIVTPNVALQKVLVDSLNQLSLFQPLAKTAVGSWADAEIQLAKSPNDLLFIDIDLLATELLKANLPASLLPHLANTIIIGPKKLELAHQTMNLGVLDYIAEEDISPVRIHASLTYFRVTNVAHNSQTYAQHIINSTDVGFLLINRQHKVQAVNLVAQVLIKKLTGIAPICGDDIYDIAREPQALQAILENTLQFGQTNIEIRHLDATNEEKQWFEFHYSPVVNDENEIESVCISVRDITNVHIMRETQRHLDTQLRFVLDHAPLILWTVDQQGRVLTLEGQGVEDLPANKEAFFGEPITALVDLCLLPNLTEITTDKPYIFSVPLGNKVYKNFVFLGQGDDPAFMGVSVDITDRVALDKHTRDQARLLDQISDVVVSTDMNHVIQTWNKAAERVFNIPASKALNQVAYEILPPPFNSRETMMRSQQRLAEKGELRQDFVIVNQQGEERYLEATFTSNQTDKQTMQGVISMLRDVTELRLAEEERAKLVALIENSREIITLIRPDGQIDYINPAGEVFLKDIDSLEGLCHALYLETASQNATQVMQTAEKNGWWQSNVRLYHLQMETIRDVQINLFPLKSFDAHKLLGYGLTAHDITAAKEVERELQKTLDQALELNRLRSMFINTVSHEFRNPLATILTSSDLLQAYWDRLSVSKREDRLNKIKLQVRRMVELLDDVLLIGRLEGENIAIERQMVDLPALITELLDDFSERHKERHDIHYDYSAVDSQMAFVDPRLMGQIVNNLVSNAIKYSPEGGAITVGLVLDKNNVILRVADEGIGIPDADHAGLFEMFHRAHNTGKIQGTGLGLAIVQRAVDLHNGFVEFESVVGVGTTFLITLPRN